MPADKSPRRTVLGLDLPPAARQLHVDFKKSHLDLTQGGNDTLSIVLPPDQVLGSVLLSVDAYLLDNQEHPGGHFGWWIFPTMVGKEIVIRFSSSERGLEVGSDEFPSQNSWVNDISPDPDGQRSVLVHVVLRHPVNNSILYQQSLVGFRSASALQEALALRTEMLVQANDEARWPGFNWPASARIHLVTQYLPSPRQMAQSPEVIMAARTLIRMGADVQIYASQFDPRLRGPVRSTREMLSAVEPGDVVILFYSEREVNLSWLNAVNARKGFVYLGVPDAPRLQAFDAEQYQNYIAAAKEAPGAQAFDVVGVADAGDAELLIPEVDEDTDALASGDIPARVTVKDDDPFPPVIGRPDRAEFWAGVTALPNDIGSRFLLYSQRLEAFNDFVATLTVFAQLAQLDDNLHLVAAGSRTGSAYHSYIEYLLQTRFAPINDRVHLFGDAGDGELKGLIEACEALVDVGASARSCRDDAIVFGKRLFAGGKGERDSATFRLYGTPAEQAQAIHAALGRNIPSSPQTNPEHREWKFWDLVEQLLSLPAPVVRPNSR